MSAPRMESDTQTNGAAACFSDPRSGTCEMGESIGDHSIATCASIDLAVDGSPRYRSEVWDAGQPQEGGVCAPAVAARPSARAEAPASDGSVKLDSGATRPSRDLVKALAQRILSELVARVVRKKSQSKGLWDGPEEVPKQAHAHDPDNSTLSPNTTVASDTASCHSVGVAGADRRRTAAHSPDRVLAIVPNGSGGAPVGEAAVGNTASGSRCPPTKSPTPSTPRFRSKDVNIPDCLNVVTSLTLRNSARGRLQARSATAGAEAAADVRETSWNDSGDEVLETPAAPDEIPAAVHAFGHAGSRPPSQAKLASKLERPPSMASLNGFRDGTRDLRTFGRSFGSRAFGSGHSSMVSMRSGRSMLSSSLLSSNSSDSKGRRKSGDYKSCPSQIGSAGYEGIERASMRPRMFNSMMSICEFFGGEENSDDGGSLCGKDEDIFFDSHA